MLKTKWIVFKIIHMQYNDIKYSWNASKVFVHAGCFGVLRKGIIEKYQNTLCCVKIIKCFIFLESNLSRIHFLFLYTLNIESNKLISNSNFWNATMRFTLKSWSLKFNQRPFSEMQQSSIDFESMSFRLISFELKIED